MDERMEERDDLVVLVDENGEEEHFEHLDTISMNGNEYVVLLPYHEVETNADEEEEVVILKMGAGENGEDTFLTVEDQDELDEVFEEFMSRVEDEEFDEEE